MKTTCYNVPVSRNGASPRGVTQGSHLGPILFIVFINDLIQSVAIPTEVYADDTTLHQQHQKTPNCESYLELQHAITEEWALIWHGQFGHSKTEILTTNESNLQQAITPTIEKQPIAIVRDHRHLRITLTSDLNWSSHVQSLVSIFQTLWPSPPHVTSATSCSNHSAIQVIRPSDNGARICRLARLAEGGIRRCLYDRAHSSWCCSLSAVC